MSDSECTDTSETTTCSRLEILKSVLISAYEKLISKWNYIGYSPEMMNKKYDDLEENLQQFLSDIFIEEEDRGNAKEKEIELMRENAKKLIVLLKKEEPEILGKIGSNMAPLLQFEKQLTVVYGNLIVEKEEMLNTYRKLNEEAKKIGAEVAESPPTFPAVDQLEVHSNEVISALNQFIESMKREKKIREKTVKQLRKSAQENLWLIGASPSNNHERNILQVESVLSTQLIKDLKAINLELEAKVLHAKSEREALCAKIQTLTVAAGKPAEILPSGILPDSLNRLKNTVAQLEEQVKNKNVQITENADPTLPNENGQNVLKRPFREDSPDCEIVEERTQFKRTHPCVKLKEERRAYEDESFEVHCLGIVKTEIPEIRTFDISTSDESDTDEISIMLSKYDSIPMCGNQRMTSDEELKRTEDLKGMNQFSSVPNEIDDRWKKNILWQKESDERRETEREEDLKMLKIIGASKWHDYVNGNAIWQKMTQRPEGFPERGFPLLKSRFLETVLRKLSSYGISEAEMELYKGVEEKETEFNVPSTPFNPNFNNYNLF